MKKLMKKFETLFVAAIYAQAGEFDTAKSLK